MPPLRLADSVNYASRWCFPCYGQGVIETKEGLWIICTCITGDMILPLCFGCENTRINYGTFVPPSHHKANNAQADFCLCLRSELLRNKYGTY